jgi:aspartate-semialdehyde dehydrogenase
MKPQIRILAAAVALALSGAGAYALGEEPAATPASGPAAASAPNPTQAEGPMEVTETLSGVASPEQSKEMGSKGFAAARGIGLARAALNDGYVEEATKILTDSQKLLGQVAKLDQPVTVTKDVKMSGKEVHSEQVTVTPDMIPIFSETRIVEAFEQNPAKSKAVKEAQEQLKKGDRQKAMEILKLAEVGVVTREVSMPLGATVAAVDDALKLIGEGKLHEANLALKRAGDGMVEQADVAVEPAPEVAAVAPAATPKGSGSE